MNLNHLQYLIEVAHCQSMNKAAEKLFITQPALRSAISSLESELGLPLINRSKKGCTLTPFGEKVVSEGKVILEIYSGWKNYKNSQLNLEREVHIVCFSNASNMIFSPLILQLHQQYPLLNIFLHAETALDAINAISDNHAQLALIMADVDDEPIIKKRLHSPNWKISKVYEDGFSLFTHKDSPLLTQEITTKTLEPLTFVTFSRLEMLYNPKYAFRKEGFHKDKIVYLDHYSNIFKLLMQNPDTFAILSDIFMLNNPYISAGDLRAVKTPLFDWTVGHYLIEPIDSFCDMACSLICAAIKEQYAKIRGIS